jgi:hypothetical protein
MIGRKGETPAKTLAYLTTDEVNEDTAVRMGAKQDAIVVPFYPRDTPPNEEYDAVLYDLDFLPTERRGKILNDLLSAPAGKPVALHSFNVDDRLRHDLQCKGVNVFRRLRPDCLRRLVANQYEAVGEEAISIQEEL